MARTSKPAPMPWLTQNSRLARKARQDGIVAATFASIAIGSTWWHPGPLSFNSSSPLIMFVLAFAPLSLVWAALALWSWIRNRKSGGAHLEYRRLYPAGTLTGFVRLHRPPDPMVDFTLTLLCRSNSSTFDSASDSDNYGTRWRVVWSKTSLVKAASVIANKGIPVAISLPPSKRQKSATGSSYLELQVRAKLPGLDFYQVFNPVITPS